VRGACPAGRAVIVAACRPMVAAWRWKRESGFGRHRRRSSRGAAGRVRARDHRLQRDDVVRRRATGVRVRVTWSAAYAAHPPLHDRVHQWGLIRTASWSAGAGFSCPYGLPRWSVGHLGANGRSPSGVQVISVRRSSAIRRTSPGRTFSGSSECARRPTARRIVRSADWCRRHRCRPGPRRFARRSRRSACPRADDAGSRARITASTTVAVSAGISSTPTIESITWMVLVTGFAWRSESTAPNASSNVR
jgi:hypothetical protein